MGSWKELHRSQARNGIIAANAEEAFGQLANDQAQRQQHGSFNVATIIVLNASGAGVKLDGLSTRQFDLEQPGTFRIEPDEGEFFEWVTIKDISGAGIAANKVIVKLAIAERIGG